MQFRQQNIPSLRAGRPIAVSEVRRISAKFVDQQVEADWDTCDQRRSAPDLPERGVAQLLCCPREGQGPLNQPDDPIETPPFSLSVM